MNAPKAIMLFAAGFGTRMGELTADRPKPLVNVLKKPLIDHTLEIVDNFGPLRKVVNTHYKAPMLADYLAGRDILVSDEQPDILDTGGGLKAALPLLAADPVFTMNTDAIWAGPNPLSCLAKAWDPNRMDALLICVPVGNTVGRVGGGDFSLDPDGRLARHGDYVYGGVQILKTGAVELIDQKVFSLNRVWDDLSQSGRIFGCAYPGRWCDVGHPQGIGLAEQLLKNA